MVHVVKKIRIKRRGVTGVVLFYTGDEGCSIMCHLSGHWSEAREAILTVHWGKHSREGGMKFTSLMFPSIPKIPRNILISSLPYNLNYPLDLLPFNLLNNFTPSPSSQIFWVSLPAAWHPFQPLTKITVFLPTVRPPTYISGSGDHSALLLPSESLLGLVSVESLPVNKLSHLRASIPSLPPSFSQS